MTQNSWKGLLYSGTKDVGLKREENEDSFCLEPLPDNSALLAVVSDGMGGMGGGDVASRISVDELKVFLVKGVPVDRRERMEMFIAAFSHADETVRKAAQETIGLGSMGATLVAVLVEPGEFLHLYAGDSRLYHFRDGELLYVTRDHTIVQTLIDLNRITPEQARTHKMRSILTSCIGNRGSGMQMDVEPKWNDEGNEQPAFRPFLPGDTIVLSSDGFHGEVERDVLLALVREHFAHPEKLVYAAIEAAKASGGKDNITLIAIHYPKQQELEPEKLLEETVVAEQAPNQAEKSGTSVPSTGAAPESNTPISTNETITETSILETSGNQAEKL